MSEGGQQKWPPQWTQRQGRLPKPVHGEVGVLRYVYSRPDAPQCYIVMEHQGESYIGFMSFEDARRCGRIIHFLRGQYGRCLSDIGEHELPPQF
jgi:hypothetical protein